MKKVTAVLLVLAFVLVAPAMVSAQNMLDQRLTKIEEMVKGLKQNQMMGFHLYASLRPHLGYYSADEEYLGGPAMDPNIGITADDDYGTILSVGGQSRFGAKAIVSKDLYGVIEYGLTETDRGGEVSDPYLRLAYGVWNFGSGKLTVGKDYTPGTFLGYSSMMGDLGDQGDANMLVAGLSYIGRQPQVKLSFGNFDIALIEPNTGAYDFSRDAYLDLTTDLTGEAGVNRDLFGQTFDTDFVIPRIEAAYVFRLDNINIRPVVGYQTYDMEYYNAVTGEEGDESIDSILAGLGVSATFEPAYVKGTFTWMQNAGNYGQTNIGMVNALNNPQDPDGWTDSAIYLGAGVDGLPFGPGLSILNAQLVNGSVEDSELMQGTLVAGAQINDTFGLEAGFGYMSAEVDLPGFTTAKVSATTGATAEQTSFVYYLQAPVQLAKGIQVIPEIGMVDRGDLEIDDQDDIDSGSLSYIDFNFRCDF